MENDLSKTKYCNSKGKKSGLLTFGLAGGLSYAALQMPAIGRLVPHKYHIPVILGSSIVSSYIVASHVTRKCYRDEY